MAAELYECKECGRQEEVDATKQVPECCGKPMEAMPFCTKTDTAEHARAHDNGDACDDGRAGGNS